MIYEIVTRVDPWLGYTAYQVIQAVASGERMKIHSECPPIPRKVMEMCWQADPQDRPDVADILEILLSKSNDSDAVQPVTTQNKNEDVGVYTVTSDTPIQP